MVASRRTPSMVSHEKERFGSHRAQSRSHDYFAYFGFSSTLILIANRCVEAAQSGSWVRLDQANFGSD